jgi:hypothetical protein
MVAWFVSRAAATVLSVAEREIRKPTTATVAVAPTLKMVAAALMNADSAAGSMPGCYGQTGVLGQAEHEQRALNWVAWRLVIIRTAGLQFGLQFIAVRTGSLGYARAV